MLYTSAINQLCDDSEKEPIVAGLLAAHRIFVTAVNCVEVLGTKSAQRREQLYVLLRELAKRQEPLALPIDLLKSQTLDYAAGRDRPASQDLNYGMWVDNYFKLDGKENEEIQYLKKSWEVRILRFSEFRQRLLIG